MTDQRDAWGERLPRHLGLWSAVAVLVGTTIGSGIFRVPASVATLVPEPGPFLLAWVVGGLVTLAGALTVAELAAAFPRSGGIFAYVYEGFGPLPAFLFGWTELLVLRASALGAIATILAEHLGQLVPLTPMGIKLVAAGTVAAVGLLNYVGMGRAAGVMNVVTVLKYGALLALVVLALSVGTGSAAHFIPFASGGVRAAAFGTALVSILWAYDGWSNLSFSGGEVKDPTRNLPLGLALGTGAIVLIYVSINVAYLYLMPIPEMAQATRVAAEAATRIPLLGSAGAAVVAGIVMLSCFGSLNGSMMTGPRVLFALAERGLFFPGIARVSPRFESPSTAIALATTLGVTYVLLNDFQQLADKFVLGSWPFYCLAVAAVFVLRRRRPDLPRPYRTWGYPLVPLFFLLASAGLIVNALVTAPRDTALTFAIILAGIPAYLLWQRRAHGSR